MKLFERILTWICFSLLFELTMGQETCLQGTNCKLPHCFCATTKHSMPVDKMPQIVYFAFDDEITSAIANHYERLFHPSRKNPNGCPVTMTMFAANRSTDYTVMDQLYSRGMEIGAHGSIHTTDKAGIINKTRHFKDYVEQMTNMSANDILGYRSPYLATGGDKQIDALTKNGFKYDISYTYTRRPEDSSNVWPFTLDFGWKYPCNINPCPINSHKGFWVVPINSMYDYMNSDICAYADSCTYSPPSANELYKYLWNNFNNSYSKNKVPFGVHLHGRWLGDEMRLWAVDRFIRELLKLPDVYILSVKTMLEWMENPLMLPDMIKLKQPSCHFDSKVVESLPSLPERCEQDVNCHLPDCFCDHLNHHLPNSQIPQLVYFAFDGPIDGTVSSYFHTLFDQSKRNPNNCPLRFNIFLSHEGTDYKIVQELFDSGAEIGTHGLGDTYLATKQSVLEEAKQMKQNIASRTNIAASSIKGFRSPHLSTAGDDQVEALKESGYTYDISYTFTRRPFKAFDAWPVTLNFGWPYVCNSDPCPEQSHKGFWEVPINALYDLEQTDLCTYADECRNQPKTEDDTYQYLMDNFMNSYRGNRAPFGLHLKPRWFHIHRNLRGVNKFIDEIVKMLDVYIISVGEVIEWMKRPLPLENVANFTGWSCPDVHNEPLHVSPRQLPEVPSECQNGVNCHLPECFCASLFHPMPKRDIPQMVYFAFDDDVSLKHSKYYFNLFGPTVRNPNNCPVSYTLFTVDKGTDYSFVEYFYQRGIEIASHGVNNVPTNTKMLILSEAGTQKQNILDKTNVTAGEIIGFRSPQLATAGDDQIDVLKKLGYTYDASYTFTRRPEFSNNAWPFTGDYGWTWDCNIPPCPYYSHKGFWFVPVNSMWDYTKENICTFADECQNKPKTEGDVFTYLWENFQNSYTGNRAPFGLHLQPLWFNSIENFKGMKRFIDKLQELDDTYIVSIAKMLQWMQNPIPLKNIKDFRPWGCAQTKSNINQASPITTKPPPPVLARTNKNDMLDLKVVKETSVVSRQISSPLVAETGMGVPIQMSVSRLSISKPKSNIPLLQTERDVQSLNDKSMNINSKLDLTLSNRAIDDADTHEVNTSSTCIQGQTCKLPHCFCQGRVIPRHLPRDSVPQMVFLAFDGTLNHADHGPYLSLLANRKNPNNCSISATFFVNHVGSNNSAIKDMYDRGFEIAMRGYNVLRPANGSQLESEILRQKAELNRNGIFNVAGWKTVGYTSLTDEFKDVVEQHGFLYDSTNYYDNENHLWPYTLDFGQTPTPFLWEIPNLALTDYLNVYQCQYADGCFNNPRTVNETFDFLWNSFRKHYMQGNKAPFGISLRKTWLSHVIYNSNIEGLKMFLNAILSFQDVYVVSTKQIMEWMKTPTPLADIPNSEIWRCT